MGLEVAEADLDLVRVAVGGVAGGVVGRLLVTTSVVGCADVKVGVAAG
ncbi:hypothetical protein G9U51_13585 [Calidifontibacter sp. DB0510]|uniref:Uncharacterized protein n=1 Tax=Metallococcus carri TaxID=1656884 RepID=A0A967EFP0_9MICO|nr:hypothetical protein [Metallococcus carri]NHN56806.1 hypothetical protein [Metallococcus carri]NOP37817.1 hypothetical protein [Calidifontibacter sp. DB2511S]